MPLAHIVIAADDDHATEGNSGVTKASEAAELIGGTVAVPVFLQPSQVPVVALRLEAVHEFGRQLLDESYPGTPGRPHLVLDAARLPHAGPLVTPRRQGGLDVDDGA